MSGTPTFAVAPSFLGLSRHDRDAAYAVAGIPLDIGVTNRTGARSGPGAVRAASRMLTDGDHPHFWIDPVKLDVADIGDFPIALGDLAESYRMIERQAEGLNHLLAIGGEHGITLPLLRALRRKVGAPLGLVHFDAHVDTWPDNFGQVYGHGSPFYHAIEEGLVDPKRMIQIGIRSRIASVRFAALGPGRFNAASIRASVKIMMVRLRFQGGAPERHGYDREQNHSRAAAISMARRSEPARQ